MPDEIPDNVDLAWIARTLMALREDTGAVKRRIAAIEESLAGLRDHVDVVVTSNLRLERGQTAMREDVNRLFELNRDLRERIAP